MKTQPHNLCLVIGALMAAWHALSAVLVALGVAQPIIGFIFWANFLNQPFHVEPLALSRAVVLVAVTGLIGYVFGLAGGLIWNRFKRG